ncbi:MAG TPA: MBL fold metallo-hydrolase [Geminicoccaceae bacterium]|nr:MBL fold metallo-hydrolase [Geminicoccaceae bacterium]
MRVHHLNCGTFCPAGGRIMDGHSRGLTGRLVCHCLLLETDRRLVLVDTGLGMRDVETPYPRLSRLYVNLLNIQLDSERTALRQVRRLGFAPADVRHIVLTHLDFDHAGGLEDLPAATVHVLQAETDCASRRRGFVGRRRYRPQQWDEVEHWQRYTGGGEPWFGFEAVRDLNGLPPEILMIPLPGHTLGHAGIAMQTRDGWLLNAGDACFHHGEMRPNGGYCPPGLRAYQSLMEMDRALRLHNQERLRRLHADASAQVRIFCGHDAVELERLSAAP